MQGNVPWGKPRKMKGRRLYEAKVRKENGEIIDFIFENGQREVKRIRPKMSIKRNLQMLMVSYQLKK